MKRSKVCEDLRHVLLEIVKVIVLFPFLSVIKPFAEVINSIIDLIFDAADKKECEDDRRFCFF